jgi:hypothetical protein
MTTEATTFTQAQMDAAVATATKAGADAERARITAIMRDPNAKGREAAAMSFALDTQMSVAEATKVLPNTPLAASVLPTVAERDAKLPQLGHDAVPPQQAKQQAAQAWGDLASNINAERGFRN